MQQNAIDSYHSVTHSLTQAVSWQNLLDHDGQSLTLVFE